MSIKTAINVYGQTVCDHTGLVFYQKPEWTDIPFGENYRANIFLIGNGTIVSQVTGVATLSAVRPALDLNKQVIDETIAPEGVFVQIQDYSQLERVTFNARRYYINYINSRSRLRGLIFIGISSLMKLSIKLAHRITQVRYPVVIADDYSDAVRKSEQILRDEGADAKNINISLAHSIMASVDSHGNRNSSYKSGESKETTWVFQSDEFRVDYNIIGNRIVHAVSKGWLKSDHLSDMFAQNEIILNTLPVPPEERAFIFGIRDVHSSSVKVRKQYLDHIRSLHKRCPFSTVIFYGGNQLINAAIRLSRLGTPFKIYIKSDLDESINLLLQDQRKISSYQSDQDKVFKVSNQDIDQLLDYMGQINWENKNVVEEPAFPKTKNPLAPIYDAVSLIKAEMDQVYTERQKAQSALQKAFDKLEQRVLERTSDLEKAKLDAEFANRSKSVFLANMSHELRTPLNHIIGFTELVVDGHFGDLNSVQKEYLNDVLTSSGHLLALVSDILDLSKVEAGKLSFNAEHVSLSPIIENSLKMVEDQISKKKIKLTLETDNLQTTAYLDKRKIKQIFYNLLSNAVKYTPDGGTIRFQAESFFPKSVDNAMDIKKTAFETQSSYNKFTISDSGIGLPSESLKIIFDPFEQLDNKTNRKTIGTGLGLPLTKRLVKLHGGNIWAESEGPGKGSRFIVLIPQRDHKDGVDLQSG